MYVQFKVMSLIIFLFTVDAKVHRFLMFNKKTYFKKSEFSSPRLFPSNTGQSFYNSGKSKKKRKILTSKGGIKLDRNMYSMAKVSQLMSLRSQRESKLFVSLTNFPNKIST